MKQQSGIQMRMELPFVKLTGDIWNMQPLFIF